jgi:uncharacterized protein (DUF362 family)/NAD-dependent dihydropyrimidine dehydrogenase PreA subunit
MNNEVSSVKCESYDQEEVFLSVREALLKIDFILPENKTVLIKPNIMSQNRPEQHSITHYSIIEALCRLLKENNCRIQIGESIAFYQNGLTRKAFETSKIKEVADKYGALLIAFDEEELFGVQIDDAFLKELYIPKCLFEADMVINVCKLKTHGGMRLSGALKNMFGCLPGGYKQKIHMWSKNDFELSDIFLDIHKIIKPALSIMDAVVSLDGGPSAIGKPVKTSRILASTNAAALDLAACKIVGYEPTDVATLICARKRNMISNFTDVQILGDLVPMEFKTLIKGKIAEQYGRTGIFVKYTYVNPAIVNSKCINCGKCVNLCPVSAIKQSDTRIIIDINRCINCYCCLNICPEKAVTIKSSFMNKFIRAMRYILGI